VTAADKRVTELLERWLASVERHALYLKLDDAAYARAEAWPKHQRPNALVVNLARTRLLELKAHLDERRAAADDRFAESLELMSFLTTLLGSEHIDRFIPLATGKPVDTGISATVEQPRIKQGESSAKAPATSRARPARAASAPPPRTQAPARAAPAARAPTARTTAAPDPPLTPARLPDDAMVQKVVADAVRMLEWGREWPAVAGLIARMADRPTEAEVWKILRTYRTQILGKGRRSVG
jgi:hypothetical protein